MANEYRPHSHVRHHSNFRYHSPEMSRAALQGYKNARYMALYQLLLEIFPRDRDTLLVPRRATPSSSLDPSDYGSKDDTYILIDLSNIYIGFNKALHAKYPPTAPDSGSTMRSSSSSGNTSFKMDLEALDMILQRGRSSIRKIMCGSYPRKNSSAAFLYQAMFEQGRSLGYEVSVMERAATAIASPSRSDESDIVTPNMSPSSSAMKEHGVDEMLSFQILEFVLSRTHKRPGTIVLTTGDGQPGTLAGSIGFYRAVEKALANGWSVELYSFGSSLSQNWVRLRDSIAQSSSRTAKFKIIYLDEFVLDLHDEAYAAIPYRR